MFAFRKLGVSFFAFLIKGCCALYLSIRLANFLSVPDFSEWAIFFSVTMLLSISDLGIGQYIVTSFSRKDISFGEKDVCFRQSLSALIYISLFVLGAGLLLLIIVERVNSTYIILLFSLVVRIPITAYSAFIQSKDKVHEKKVIEALSYVLALSVVEYLMASQAGLNLLLVGFNVSITIVQFIIVLRARYLNCPLLNFGQWKIAIDIFRGALPYLANNSSGLFIYGGFVSFASFVLNDFMLAYISILHATIFTYGYQVCELVFRVNQLKFVEVKFFESIRGAFLISTLIVAGVLVFFGETLFDMLYRKYDFNIEEILLFYLYSCLEFYYLLYVFRIQINVSLSKWLLRLSILKTFMFILAIGIYSVIGHASFELFVTLLLVASIIVVALTKYNIKESYDYS